MIILWSRNFLQIITPVLILFFHLTPTRLSSSHRINHLSARPLGTLYIPWLQLMLYIFG